MRKNQFIVILVVLLIISSIISVTIYRNKIAVEEQFRERDTRASFSVMMLMHSEVSRFKKMYEREVLTQELLDEHRDVLWDICNTSTRLVSSNPLNTVRYIVVQNIDEVDEDLYLRYAELSDYLFGIYLEKPDSYEVDGEVYSDEFEYLYDIYSSEEHKNEIQRIVGLD